MSSAILTEDFSFPPVFNLRSSKIRDDTVLKSFLTAGPAGKKNTPWSNFSLSLAHPNPAQDKASIFVSIFMSNSLENGFYIL